MLADIFVHIFRVEKYRPQTLDDLISHKDILIQKFISEDRLPHFLFYGPPGTGKTSTILACAKQLYKDKEFNAMVLELNASDDRGIDVVPGPVLSFGFKLVILNEADAMTWDAQNALRRVIEKYTENTLSRPCSPDAPGSVLSQDQMMPRLEYVIQQESLDITPDGIKAIVTLSSGDMRRSLNILQSTSMAYGKVTEDNVYTCTGHPLRSDIANILGWSLNKDFTSAYNQILQLKTPKGLALHDILTEVHLLIHRGKHRTGLVLQILYVRHRLASGANEKTQLSSMVAAFQAVRAIWVNDATKTSGPQTVTTI
uniref:Activator 1 subunit 5 n=1 Tax=Hucho hucho TaxID=62062 RepID=A0A4W5QYR3_9TELE